MFLFLKKLIINIVNDDSAEKLLNDGSEDSNKINIILNEDLYFNKNLYIHFIYV